MYFQGDPKIKCQLIAFLKLSLTFFPLVVPLGSLLGLDPNGPTCFSPEL